MGKIAKLLKWSKPVILRDSKGKAVETVWIRVLDDDDLQDAYLDARLASAKLRAELRDPESKKHKDDVLKIEGATKAEAIQLIKAASGSNLTAEAFANVERPELPKLEDIAIDPDAPTLEEQEKLDAAIDKVNKEYGEAIDQYVETRDLQISNELEARTQEDLIEAAKDSTIDLLALSLFVSRVLDEKIWRGTYEDKTLKVHGFEDWAEFDTTDSTIKDQLREAYNDFELNPEEVKN